MENRKCSGNPRSLGGKCRQENNDAICQDGNLKEQDWRWRKCPIPSCQVKVLLLPVEEISSSSPSLCCLLSGHTAHVHVPASLAVGVAMRPSSRQM